MKHPRRQADTQENDYNGLSNNLDLTAKFAKKAQRPRRGYMFVAPYERSEMRGDKEVAKETRPSRFSKPGRSEVKIRF